MRLVNLQKVLDTQYATITECISEYYNVSEEKVMHRTGDRWGMHNKLNSEVKQFLLPNESVVSISIEVLEDFTIFWEFKRKLTVNKNKYRRNIFAL